MDKSTLKSKINFKVIIIVTFALICPISIIQTVNEIKYHDKMSKSLTHGESQKMIVNQLKSNNMFK